MKIIKGLIFSVFILSFGCSEPDAPIAISQFSVYPNPATDRAMATIANEDGKPYHLIMFDTKGEIIGEWNDDLTYPTYEIPLQGSGVYQIILTLDNTTYTQRLIKL